MPVSECQARRRVFTEKQEHDMAAGLTDVGQPQMVEKAHTAPPHPAHADQRRVRR